VSNTPFSYWFTVDHVHDGDTIMGVLDMGLGHYLGRLGGPTWSLRMYGINAPELFSTDPATRILAQQSRDHLQTLIAAGDYVRLDSMGWDKYGMRLDAVVYNMDGVDLNQAQLDGGYAVPYE
jgi:endonuclease YncB( thermonuclease family)